MPSTDRTTSRSEGDQTPAAPSISLPRGGGAVRGIGEKFAANPVTGTGSMSVPIATSRGRSGFDPQLSLSYDSGSGNGSFGFGWSLSLPSITRKTDKGLPQYNDADESDVFILFGAEDLVPMLNPDGTRHDDDTTAPGYTIRRYRPRTEGLFARIERWTRRSDGEVHWRSISRDNILTLYGLEARARIADPEDPRRIFTWLICETRDDKGNAVLYEYKQEDGAGVDLARAHEANRGDRDDPRRATNRYLKRIRYGNRVPLLDGAGQRPRSLTDEEIENAGWMFEVVFDYDEGHVINESTDGDGRTFLEASAASTQAWTYRSDPFSTYRAGFEVRAGRLCRRALMFHHFEGEAGVGNDCLVRSTDFTYSHEDPASARNPVYTFLHAVTQTGYGRNNVGYEKRSLPPVEFEYTLPLVQDTVEEVDPASLENLPIGVDGATSRWTDLHGEGIPGILTEQAGTWFYKRNLSPISERPVELAPLERVAARPNLALAGGHAQFMDLAADGRPDLVVLDGPTPGFYEHDGDEGWQSFRPFVSSLNRDVRDPDLKFVDLDGDGHADVLITEDDTLVWHPSLGEPGFGPARRVARALDEEKGPRLVFADGTQSIYLADLSGDGLTDLARIRNGEVCYWPNLGYGRFGGRVTMDHSPRFDNPDQFDQNRIRLADIDGSGTTDIIYLHRDGVRLYFNQSGNSWSEPRLLNAFPRVDDLASIVPTDLLGNGTACLVWSSPLPGDARRPMRYVNLMGGQKPHLLVKTVNNLGAETVVRYTPSTRFYLEDKRDGKPWITRLPFPVHVVERVETYDQISRNRFVTRYAYHHGYFDGEQREFRGFGMVEQWDTEQLAALSNSDAFPVGDNVAAESHVPPIHTKTWFHTGVYLGRDHVSDFFAGLLNATDQGEYFREPGLTDEEAANLGLDDEARPLYDDARARDLLLNDTILPAGLTLEEEREACRALKGSMLRQEVYALDGTPKEEYPYTVAEQNFSVRLEQPRGGNRHAVFFTHAREAITYHYERNPADPRVQHALTLEVDPYGNVLKEAAIGYGRRRPDMSLSPEDQTRQTRTLMTYAESRVTNPIDDVTVDPDVYRAPLPCETRTYELTGYAPTGAAGRFQSADFVRAAGQGLTHVFDTEIDYEDPTTNGRERRLIEHVRTLYRPDDLGAGENDPLTLMPLGTVERCPLPGESYKLAFTPGLLAQVFQRDGQSLLGNPADVLGGRAADQGGYLPSQQLKADGRFPDTDPDDHWWIPAGRVFLSPNSNDTAAQELAHARQHFFLPRRYRDPFHTDAVSTERFVTYAYDLLIVEIRDAVGNVITVATQDDAGDTTIRLDYRVLQPYGVTDPNGNRTEVAFDILGMVVGTAVMGKPGENLGDSLAGFEADLSEAVVIDHLNNPLTVPHAILGRATTRVLYDLFAYQRTRDQADPQPSVVYTLARETHDADLQPGEQTRIQHRFSYSDGFGREIQKKIQAEPEKIKGVAGSPRWVGSGWTIFNNKGKPVRQYEPFFSATHGFEFDVQVGVSPILFYDPVERVVATLHPNGTYDKVAFDPWRQVTHDVNDTVTSDPRTDEDIRGYTNSFFTAESAQWQTWYAQRIGVDVVPEEQDAATKAAAHANTPTTAHFDTLGRPFLNLTHNGFNPDTTPIHFATRVERDIEGNQRAVRDAIEQAGDSQGRIVMRYDYDMLGNRIHQRSMEAGARWMLNDAAGKPIRAWDDRGHTFRTEYGPLRRPMRFFVTGADSANPDEELLTERLVYGEQHPEAERRNLRGKLYLHLDQAGVVASEAHDFKSNPRGTSRRFATEYRQPLNWSTVDAALPGDAMTELDPATLEGALAPRLEAESYTSDTTYDALNRPVTLTTPHTPAMQPNVIRPGYNEANLLERVDANMRGATSDGQPVWTPFVTGIDYDARGHRQRIDYGNGASTFYDYDPLTFRLIQLVTRRDAIGFPDDCPQPPPAGWSGCQVQNLRYTYDPVGNITHIRDDAQQTIYFCNPRVEPSADYRYDAMYRLTEATGREHIGQASGAPLTHSHDDALRSRLPHPGDGNAMGRYCENYVYDAVGNLMEMIHRRSCPGIPAWTRTYVYGETSLIEDGTGGAPLKTGNRLSSTTVGNGNSPVERYLYDAHGSMTRMPHLSGAHPAPNMHRDYRDQLHQIDLGGGGMAYSVYDASGRRVRKVWEKSANLVEERIFLGGFEIFRRLQGAERLERETLHVMDARQRIALVETRTLDTAGDDPATAQLIRYEFGNHLGSASLELDDESHVISYEEYTPYGSTTYQAVRTDVEVSPKRYRYTGMERDEESGLNYHAARYYAPWLGRWTRCDPVGIGAGVNVYCFVTGNPVRLIDPSGTDDEEPGLLTRSPIEAQYAEMHRQREHLWIEAQRPGLRGDVDVGYAAEAYLVWGLSGVAEDLHNATLRPVGLFLTLFGAEIIGHAGRALFSAETAIAEGVFGRASGAAVEESVQVIPRAPTATAVDPPPPAPPEPPAPPPAAPPAPAPRGPAPPAASGRPGTLPPDAPTPPMGVRAPPRLSYESPTEIRATWGAQGTDAIATFSPANGGVKLTYIKIRTGFGPQAPQLLADALRTAGIRQPSFIESTVIINRTIQRLLSSNTAANFALAERMIRVQGMAFAEAMGGRLVGGGLVRNQAGKWIARIELAY
jgi:RHS repeat-associated protein